MTSGTDNAEFNSCNHGLSFGFPLIEAFLAADRLLANMRTIPNMRSPFRQNSTYLSFVADVGKLTSSCLISFASADVVMGLYASIPIYLSVLQSCQWFHRHGYCLQMPFLFVGILTVYFYFRDIHPDHENRSGMTNSRISYVSICAPGLYDAFHDVSAAPSVLKRGRQQQ